MRERYLVLGLAGISLAIPALAMTEGMRDDSGESS